MSATPPPGYTPPPADLPQRGDRATFSDRVDAWVTWFSTVILTQLAAMVANAYANAVDAFASAASAASNAATAAAAAISAMSSANVVVWVSGTTYAQYSVVVSPLSKIAYRKLTTAAGGTTDPSLDTTNWGLVYGVGDNQVIVSGGNGAGSTATAIRRYTTIKRNVGTNITYADSAVNGATFTINEAGLYEISVRDTGNTGSASAGASVNTTTPTVVASSANGVVCYTIVGDSTSAVTRTVRLAVGDVVRSHGTGSTNTTAEFSIVRVA